MPPQVLIVDDQADVLSLCSSILERLGYGVRKETSGEKALQFLYDHDVDLLVTDVMMPGMSGIELLEEVHDEISPGLATVVVTGFGDMDVAVKALRAGAHDFVTKPFKMQTFQEAVEHALTQARYAEESARLHALLPLFELSKRSVADADMEDWCADMMDMAVSTTDAHCAGLFLADAVEDVFSLAAMTDEGPSLLPDCGPLLEQVRGERQATVLGPGDDLPSEIVTCMEDEGIGELLCAPLRAPNRLVGALVVGRAEGSPSFEESSVELLSILSNQAAAFLENARLVRELEEWNRELEERVDQRTEELRQAQDRLIRAERLATIGELGASVAHELRNPLGVISNSMYYLKTRLGDQNGKVVKHLDIIGREVKTANRIITDLMNFVRSKNLEVDAEDPGALLRHSLERAKIPEDVDVHMDVNGDLPAVRVDGDKAGQVVLNLVDNAVEAMPEGGDLYIDAEAGEDGVVFTFEDTGVGIPPENLEKIFEPLFTTKTKGIGLGLSIVKLLVEAHGGDIDVESEEGQGARFTVRLPYEEEKVVS